MSEQHFTRPNVKPVITYIGTTPEQRQMSTDEFKAKFDEMTVNLQNYIKETLLTELDAFKQEFMTHLAEDVTQADVIQTTEVNDSTKVPSSVVTHALQQWINSRYQIIKGDVLAWALTCEAGITSFYATEPVSNIPTRTYSLGFVLKTAEQLSHIFIADRQNGKVYKNTYNPSSQAWLGWQEINMTAV